MRAPREPSKETFWLYLLRILEVTTQRPFDPQKFSGSFDGVFKGQNLTSASLNSDRWVTICKVRSSLIWVATGPPGITSLKTKSALHAHRDRIRMNFFHLFLKGLVITDSIEKSLDVLCIHRSAAVLEQRSSHKGYHADGGRMADKTAEYLPLYAMRLSGGSSDSSKFIPTGESFLSLCAASFKRSGSSRRKRIRLLQQPLVVVQGM